MLTAVAVTVVLTFAAGFAATVGVVVAIAAIGYGAAQMLPSSEPVAT